MVKGVTIYTLPIILSTPKFRNFIILGQVPRYGMHVPSWLHQLTLRHVLQTILRGVNFNLEPNLKP